MQTINGDCAVLTGGPGLLVLDSYLCTQVRCRGALVELELSAFQDLALFLAVLLHDLQLAVVGLDLIGLVLDLVTGIRVIEENFTLVLQHSGVANLLALNLESQRHLGTGLNLGQTLIGQLNDELVSVLSRIVDIVVTGAQNRVTSLDLGNLLEVQALIQLILEAESLQALALAPGRSVGVNGVGVTILDVLIRILDGLLSLGLRVLRVSNDVVVPRVRCLIDHRNGNDERSTSNDAGRSVCFLDQVDAQIQVIEGSLAIGTCGLFLDVTSLILILDVCSRLREG